MSRDENDRSYEDGQSRPLNPELTGDVLSPRYSNDDTDEQPAIVVSGNETYIMPSDGAPLERYPPQDAATPYPSEGTSSYAPQDGTAQHADALYSDAQHADALHADALDGDAPYVDALYGDAQHGNAGYGEIEGGAHRADGEQAGYADADSGSHRLQDTGPLQDADDYGDPAYLPLDKGYETSADDEDGEPRRGFLGSGWTDANQENPADKEVRRRTKLLVAAAAAVVVLGAGAGWMLTGTSSDDPCATDRCASAGRVSAPPTSAVPDPEDTGEAADEPDESATPEPSTSSTVAPTPTAARVRVSRTPEPRVTRTRAVEPTTRATGRASRQPTTVDDAATTRDDDVEAKTSEQPTAPVATTQAPPATTQAPAPAPSETQKGLFDILFPWS